MSRSNAYRAWRLTLPIWLGALLLVLLSVAVAAQRGNSLSLTLKPLSQPTATPASTSAAPAASGTEAVTQTSEAERPSPPSPATTPGETTPAGSTSSDQGEDGGPSLRLVAGVVLVAAVLGLLAIGIIWQLRKRQAGPAEPPPATAVPVTQEPPPAPSPPSPGAFLESAYVPGLRLRLHDDVTTIGRADDNDIKITDRYLHWETVSRHHAEIRREGDRYILYDRGSQNGVYVQGRRTMKNLLQHGWRIGIGGVEFVFHEEVSSQ